MWGLESLGKGEWVRRARANFWSCLWEAEGLARSAEDLDNAARVCPMLSSCFELRRAKRLTVASDPFFRAAPGLPW